MSDVSVAAGTDAALLALLADDTLTAKRRK
jgi:hypothetical protein